MSENDRSMKWILGGAWLLTLATGGGLLWAQSAEIAELRERVEAGATQAGGEFEPGDLEPTTDREMARRVLALEAEVARLGRTSGTIVAREGEPPTGVFGTNAGLPGTRGVVSDDAVADALDSDDPEVRERVRSVLRREVEALRQERRDERFQRRSDRANQRFDEFAERVGLSSMQSEEIKTLLESEREQIRTIFEEAREKGEFDGVREKVVDIRAQTDEEVRPNLDEEQGSEYDTMRKEEVERFMRRRGGGARSSDDSKAQANNTPKR